jgi:hypothetical protein
VLSLVGTTWYSISDENGLIGFFGFGVPMFVAGFGTAALWSDKKPLQKTLGWTSTVIGLACGVWERVKHEDWDEYDDQPEKP